MARIDLSTGGCSVQYAAETSAGTRPTSGYQKLTGIKSIPDLDPEPSSLDTTTLDETEYKTYIPRVERRRWCNSIWSEQLRAVSD